MAVPPRLQVIIISDLARVHAVNLKTYHVPHGRHNDYIVIYICDRFSGICLIWSRDRLLPPPPPHCFLTVGDKGIGKQLGTISSRHKRSAGRNIVVNRHGTALRQSVQEVPLPADFCFLFISHFALDMSCERHSDYILETGLSH